LIKITELNDYSQDFYLLSDLVLCYIKETKSLIMNAETIKTQLKNYQNALAAVDHYRKDWTKTKDFSCRAFVLFVQSRLPEC